MARASVKMVLISTRRVLSHALAAMRLVRPAQVLTNALHVLRACKLLKTVYVSVSMVDSTIWRQKLANCAERRALLARVLKAARRVQTHTSMEIRFAYSAQQMSL